MACNLHANYLVRILFLLRKIARKIYNLNFLSYNYKHDGGGFIVKPPS